jgi:transposase
MFRFDPALKVYLHREPVDGRKAINGLALLVEQALGLDPFAPALFVFSNRRRDRIKILLWERTGFWLMIKRLEADRFKWPKDAEVVTLSVEQLHWLLAGIDLAAMRPHPERKYSAGRVNRSSCPWSNPGHGDDHPDLRRIRSACC